MERRAVLGLILTGGEPCVAKERFTIDDAVQIQTPGFFVFFSGDGKRETPVLKTEQLLTDEVILRCIADRSQTALGLFYDRHSRLVYSLALRIVGNVSDAEEVTQEVFLKVWDKAADFDAAKGNVLAWVATVTRHLAIDWTRSRAHKVKTAEVSMESEALEVAELGQRSIGSPAPPDHAARLVAGALTGLSNEQRQVVELAYFHGLSHAKIAKQMGIPLGTVKTRLRQAVHELRHILFGKGG
ncbi:MAG: sigma-70 family RNA polymerase sigma factor [Limisphaerales bacterium]